MWPRCEKTRRWLLTSTGKAGRCPTPSARWLGNFSNGQSPSMSSWRRGICRGSPMFWQISSAVGSRLSGLSGVSIPRWREHSFVFGVLRRWTCSRRTSTRSFPCTTPSSRIPRPSSRMRSDIRGTGWTCTLFLPFPWSGGLWLESERPQISPWLWSPLFGRRRGGLRTSSSCWPNHLWRYLGGTGCFGSPTSTTSTRASTRWTFTRGDSQASPPKVRLFTRGAALEMSGCIWESTARLYQAKWLSFCGWCRGRGIAPVNATVPLIVDFFIHLRRDKGLSVSATKGYWATLNSVLTEGSGLVDL